MNVTRVAKSSNRNNSLVCFHLYNYVCFSPLSPHTLSSLSLLCSYTYHKQYAETDDYFAAVQQKLHSILRASLTEQTWKHPCIELNPKIPSQTRIGYRRPLWYTNDNHNNYEENYSHYFNCSDVQKHVVKP